MTLNIKSDSYVAVICEGKSEKTIINILLENSSLIFEKQNLLDGKLLEGEFRNPNKFLKKYLTLDYGGCDLYILVIKDDDKEYKIKPPYDSQITRNVLIVTSPEIEMLMIMALNKYDDYCKQKNKHKIKPSIYMKNLGYKNVKTEEFIRDFFLKYSLISAIKAYNRICPKGSKRESLNYILK